MMKILIIEDELIVARNISDLLFKNGYEVCGIADSYDKGIMKFESCKPNLVLCDIKLKGIENGIDLINALQINNSFKLIYLTAYGDEVLLEKAYKTKPETFLIKPYTDKQLLVSIQMALNATSTNIKKEEKAEPATFISQITPTELRIVHLIAEGKTSKEIADTLFISRLTVETHRKNLLRKTGFKNSLQLILFILEYKL